jgi:tRNA-specific 2-thiouridylase
VVVGPAGSGTRLVRLDEVNWLTPARTLRCAVKLRSGDSLRAAEVVPTADGAEVHLDAPVLAAPGQACVFYQGTRVLGGGFICPPQPV